MGLFTRDIETMNDLFVHQLQDIYYAEQQLGRNDAATILQKTPDEEKATDKKLTTLAESKVNLRAAS